MGERQVRTMDANIIESYVEKVYGYAVNHTYSREEADDLSQEILFTVVRELPKLKDENKFEPWLWGIASNVTKSFRRHMGKQRAMYSYDIPEDIAYEEDFDNEQEALNLRKYMISKFFRCMVGCLKTSQDIYQVAYTFVPMQDFTAQSDIDWTKSVAEVDQQLYRKYNLSAEEIAFIEEKIKPME